MKHRNQRPLVLLLSLCLLLPLVCLFTACEATPAARNAITSVTLKGDIITVKAALTEGFLESYDEKKIYLFELPSRYSTDVDLDELDPVAEVKPTAAPVLKLSLYDGVRSRLYSSYLIASYDPATRRYTALTAPVALANPSAVATVPVTDTTVERSIKGLVADSPADAVRLGVAHAIVEVYLNDLILTGWQENAVSYVWNGTTAYLNGDALEQLDDTIRIYTAADVLVYLRFRLCGTSHATEGNTPASLYAPGADDEAEAYAVDMSSAFTANIMEGFFDFMAARYAAPADGSAPVTAFIIGYRTNDAATYANAGEQGLAACVSNYEKLVRLAHTALVSHNAAGRVYISLDDRRSVEAGAGRWDVPTFLSAFAAEAALRGNYDWHLACELYAATPTEWVENSLDATYFTIRNLGTLTDLLGSDIYRTADGSTRRLLISGYAIPAVPLGTTASEENDNLQAAAYAYAYLTCVRNGRVDALVYSQYADPAPTAENEPLSGLWTVSADSTDPASTPTPTARRALYEVFKQVDTSHTASLSAAMTAIIGTPYTQLESALAGEARPVTYIAGTATLNTFEDTHRKAAALYTFADGHDHGFADAGNLTYAELATAETLGTVTLHARFDRPAVNDPMGVTVTTPATDLIGGKSLILDLYAGQAGVANTTPASVTLRLSRPAKGTVAAGEGALVYEATVSGVSGTSWQTAVFDISAFTAELDAGDDITVSILVDSPEGGSHSLGLAGVYITGVTAASDTPVALIVTIVAVLVLAVGGSVAFLYLRHRKKRT